MSELQVYVIGGRLGESIIIRTPSGKYGVIDSYATNPQDPDTNPTINRLRKLNAKHLSFVALTHPHMDHFRGLPAVFKEYEGAIDEFWKPPFGQADWSALVARFTEEAEVEPTEEGQERIRERILLFRELIDFGMAEKKRGMRTVTTQDTREMFKEVEHGFSIMCLGPSSDIVERYHNILVKNVAMKESHEETAPHNLASSVLALQYGDWLGLLGGDTERNSWDDILDRCAHPWVSQAKFVKVAHHGSPTGSYERLWSSIESETCDAVITCFASQGLPSSQGLNPIRSRGFPIYSTTSVLAGQLGSAQDRRRPSEIILLPGLRARTLGGEVRLTVNELGQSTIDFFDEAGTVDSL